MLILSKFNDYYDSVAGLGVDKTIVYHRHLEQSSLDKETLATLPEFRRFSNAPFDIDMGFIYYCGRVYPYLDVAFQLKPTGTTTYKDILYSPDDYLNFIEKFNHDGMNRLSVKMQQITKRGFLGQIHYNSLSDMARVLCKPIEMSNEFVHRLAVPVCVVKGIGKYKINKLLVKNPCLQDYHFYRVKDSYTAWTEIGMFISGVLGGQSPKLVEIEDKYKVSAHGFDDMSFRKRKKTDK